MKRILIAATAALLTASAAHAAGVKANHGSHPNVRMTACQPYLCYGFAPDDKGVAQAGVKLHQAIFGNAFMRQLFAYGAYSGAMGGAANGVHR